MAIRHPLPPNGVQMMVVNTIFTFLAILAIAARFYARHLQRKRFAVDDYLIIASLVFTLGCICIGYATVLVGGSGLHTKDATKAEVMMIMKLFVPASIFWVLATSFLKLSILFFYLSIFNMTRFRVAAYSIMGLTLIHLAVVILRTFLLCRPVEFNWDKSIHGTCGNRVQAYLATGILNLIIDLSIVALPMPALWSLKMPLKRKVAISCILGLGLVICGITAARIKFVLGLDPSDFTYKSATESIIAALELELGIVNACLPILRPLVRKFFGSDSSSPTGWVQKTEMYVLNKSNSWNKRKPGHGSKDDIYPLDTMTTAAHANNADSDLDNREGQWNADNIVVKRDVYVDRAPTQPANGPI